MYTSALLLLSSLFSGAAQAACKLDIIEPNGGYRALPGSPIDIEWATTGTHSEVYLSVHSGWGQAYYLSEVTANDGSHTWTLPPDLDHRLDYAIYVESAEAGTPTVECWDYAVLDVATRIEIGFAIDSLNDVTLNRTAYDEAVDTLSSDGLVASNGRPNITINQVSATGWARGRAVLPVRTVSRPLLSLLVDANLMVGLADIPFSPIEAGCPSLPVGLPLDIYPTYTPLDLLMRQRDAGRQYRVGFPPVFDMTPDCTFDGTRYQNWVRSLASHIETWRAVDTDGVSNLGELSWETGNEPDGQYFFWGDAAQYQAKAAAAYAGVRAVDSTSPIFYGGFGTSTVLDMGKVGESAGNDWDAFRETLRDYPDGTDTNQGFSFHLFRNPGFGAYTGGSFEKTWDDLLHEVWPEENVDRVILSAFDIFGRNKHSWQSALENSSWLTWELAELLYFAQERDIEAVYLWKLLDISSEGESSSGLTSGFFDECGYPRRSYDLLRDVWEVVEDGYVATRTPTGDIEIRGLNGMVLEASNRQAIPHTTDMYIHSCLVDDLSEALPSGVVGNRIDSTWTSMDWVIYEEVALGSHQACPSTSRVAVPVCIP